MLMDCRQVLFDFAPEGRKAAVTKVLRATWRRCRVHFTRNALAHAGKAQRRIVSAWIGTGCAQEDATAASSAPSCSSSPTNGPPSGPAT